MLPFTVAAPSWRPFTPDAGDEKARTLVARFAGERETLSWAIWRGGRQRTSTVAWVEVKNAELPVGVDPRALIAARLSATGLTEAVAMLTSRRLARYQLTNAAWEDAAAQVLATVGLSNALRVGDPPGALVVPAPGLGTINILCEVSQPLSEEAALEALSLVIEARTAAVSEALFASRRSGGVSTGTGTDCVVLAWPAEGERTAYAGKHTALGHVIGRASYQAVRSGVVAWQEENPVPHDR